jgi:hypothetical protein
MAVAVACCCTIAMPTAFAEDSTSIGAVESRLVSDAELEDYIKRVALALPMAKRERDPFGAIQDPEAAKAAIPVATDNTGNRTATPLADVVAAINIGAIMPADNRFLIGSRSITKNQEFSVTFGGRNYRLRAEEISGRRIVFRNIENNETASRDFSNMPAGMSRGGSAPAVPGMSPSGPDSPIQLDP